MIRTLATLTLATASLLTQVGAAAAPAPPKFEVWASNVNVRGSYDATGPCWSSPPRPSPTNCERIMGQFDPGYRFPVYCQVTNPQAVVGGNPYWVKTEVPDLSTGWIASYFVKNPDNRLPGVPDC